jgi:hypothetical protein
VESKTAVIALMATAFTLGAASVIVFVAAVRRMYELHRVEWEALGSPVLVNNTVEAHRAVVRYQWRRGYLKLGDRTLSALFFISAVLSLLWGATSVSVIALLVAAAIAQ